VLALHTYAAARHPRKPRRPRQPVSTVQVDPLVMAVALEFAGGDATRLRISSDGTVLVVNQGRSER
jgi:hypothetical protein